MNAEFNNRLDHIIKQYSEKNAIVYMRDNGIDEKYTFSEIAEFIHRKCDLFNNIGLKIGDRAAVIAPLSPYSALTSIALNYNGITVVLIDASLPPTYINRLLEFSDVRCLFTTREVFDVIADTTKDGIPCFEISDECNLVLFENSIENCFELEPTHDIDKDVAAIMFSSGTTGDMKGVKITYSSIMYSHKYITKYTNLTCSATYLNVLPINHIAGFSAVISCLLSGAEVGFISDMSSVSILSGFLKYNPTNFIMIPKVYEVIMNKIIAEIDSKSVLVKLYAKIVMAISRCIRKHTGIKLRFLTKPIWQKALGKNMKICGCGTAPCSPKIMCFYLDLGIDFVNVYGTTETGFPITAADCNEKYPDCGVGHMKQFSEIDIIIDTPDENGMGEIRVKTPLIMKGYFREPELTKTAFIDGYFRTGDYGYINKQGYLHLTGRIKESIVLKSGEKVAPADVDEYYLSKLKDIDLASRGITNSENYDEVHIFVEDKAYTTAERKAIKGEIENLAISAPSIYKVKEIHFIGKIPRTSIGKIKRFSLNNDDEIVDNISTVSSTDNADELLSIIKEHTHGEEITQQSELKNDLGIDSLEMFEMVTEIETKYKTDISPYLADIQTVGDLRHSIFNCTNKETDANSYFNIDEFPMCKTKHDLNQLRRIMKLSKSIWNFRIKGLENIPTNTNYLLCPNHESHLDGLWVFTAIGEETLRLQNICCMAKKEHLEHFFSRKWLKLLGGIPVDRYINPYNSIKRCIECVNAGNILLIHPEGTRTRDGRLGVFKEGSAKIAIETNRPIIPVCINGAREIYPPDKKSLKYSTCIV